MEIIRKYVHRTHGEIGTVTMTVPDQGWVLAGVSLGPKAVKHLATFALQSLQDAYASAKGMTKEDAIAAWEDKLDRILDEEIGTRASGPRGDATRAMAIQLAMQVAPGKDPKEKRAKAVFMVESNKKWLDRAREAIAWAKTDAETESDDLVPVSEDDTAEDDAAIAA